MRCRGKGESPLVSIEFKEYYESDDDDDDDEAEEAEEAEGKEGEAESDAKQPEADQEEEEDEDDNDGDEDEELAEEESTEANDDSDGSKKQKHTKDHKMQLVVDNEMCRSCHDGRPLRYVWEWRWFLFISFLSFLFFAHRWCCKACLERGFFFGFCDECHADPLAQARTEQYSPLPPSEASLGCSPGTIPCVRRVCVCVVLHCYDVVRWPSAKGCSTTARTWWRRGARA